jgi:hypothetical protein
MRRIRYAATAAAGLLLGLVSLLSALAAFAASVEPAGEGTPNSVRASRAINPGLAGWELSVMALVVTLMVGAVTAVTIKTRIRHRWHRSNSSPRVAGDDTPVGPAYVPVPQTVDPRQLQISDTNYIPTRLHQPL